MVKISTPLAFPNNFSFFSFRGYLKGLELKKANYVQPETREDQEFAEQSLYIFLRFTCALFTTVLPTFSKIHCSNMSRNSG